MRIGKVDNLDLDLGLGFRYKTRHNHDVSVHMNGFSVTLLDLISRLRNESNLFRVVPDLSSAVI